MQRDFKSEAERRAYLIANADYFTVVRYLGPGKGYERHEIHKPMGLTDAEQKAQELANSTGRPYGIYAVVDVHDTWVKNVSPN